ncbi:gamma-glutamylcyclotransferase [Algibacter agarivorans]|uniref:Gamma-glutamylcyclotransferase n=1 Tax=Algibacter agarivorans TaxID=1109741 RepID=A0ABP9GSJ6_9FLAO
MPLHSNYLFVYGTLLKDLDNDMSKFLNVHARLVGKGYFYGQLFQVSWFPGAIESTNTSEKVYGSIFNVKDFETLFKVLDDYEGVGENQPKPNLYTRELVTAFLQDGSELETWVYLYNLPTEHLKQIISGDFLKFSVDKF